jgi:hypothetical protein
MGKPYHKPTREQKKARVKYAVALLSGAVHTREIVRRLGARYGVCRRTSELYLARARAALVERTGRPVEQHRLDAFAFYESVIRDPEATVREKLLAQARIDKLLGLELTRNMSAR